MSVRMKHLVPAASILGLVVVAACSALPARPADAADSVTVVGTLTDEGVECQAMRGDDGKLYTLAQKDGGGFATGDKVRVVGTIADMSNCMQGTTIVVTEITKDP